MRTTQKERWTNDGHLNGFMADNARTVLRVLHVECYTMKVRKVF